MLDITGFSIKNFRFAMITILLMAIIGVQVYLNYPSREDPSIVIRQAQVMTYAPGMSPLKVEQLVTKPIETKLREIAEVDTISSDSKTGMSLVKVDIQDFVPSDELDKVWQDLRNKMDDVVSELPDGALPPIVKDEVGLTSIASIAMWGEGFSRVEVQHFAEDIRDKIYTLDGTKKVELYGFQDEQIFVEFPPTIIKKGIQVASVIDQMVSQNVVVSGGEINADGRRVIIEPSGNFESLDDIRSLQVSIQGTDDVVRLDDIANVSRGYEDPPRSPIVFNTEPAVVLSVSIIDGVNSVEYGTRLQQLTTQLQNELPIGVVMEYATYQPELVEVAVAGAVNNLYQTLVIVLLVVMTFLGVRTGLIVGAFVPITMLVSIVIMFQMGVELQRMSIAAMIIALGMLVDNGIVIAESINIKMKQGLDRAQAALETGRGLAIPLLTSTLTTILFFMPIAMAEGSTGEFTLSLAQVVSIVLLVSWFLSLYMTPALSMKFMKVDNKPEAPSKVDAIYVGLISRVIQYKLIFFVLLALVFAGSLVLMSKLDKEFFPLGERNQFLIYMDLPAGTSIYQTHESTQRLSDWLANKEVNPEVSSTISYVASGGPRFFLSLAPLDPDAHKSFTLVNVSDPALVNDVLMRTRVHVLDAFPEARIEAKQMWMGGTESGLFELRITSEDIDLLYEKSQKVLASLSDISGMAIIKQDWENPTVKLNVEIDQAYARQLGITSEQVANVLNTYFSGKPVSDFREHDDVIPIVVRSDKGSEHSLSELPDIQLYSPEFDAWVPLIQVVTLNGTWQQSRIKRRDQERTMTVIAKHESKPATYVLEHIQPVLDEMAKEQGYRFELGGEIEGQSEANEKLFANFPIAFALIFLLLIWQFNSLRKTAVILLTIPLVTIGASLGLTIMNAPFGFMVILGFFSLAGIIINNGIVLIDQISIEESVTPSKYDALLNACRSRLRPILITTLTTVLGLVPLILSFDPLFYGMASAMAFGLAVGSMLTLFCVPAFYALLFSVKSA